MVMIRSGLCSVTLRDTSIQDVVKVASAAGLSGIEWGGDVHCPPGDRHSALRARRLTEEAGLTVASYGSYLDSAKDDMREAKAVIKTAVALGAPRIRIWAGHGAELGDDSGMQIAIQNVRMMAERAAGEGVSLAFEFHEGTWTGSAQLALELLDRCELDSLGVYWQPYSVPPRPDHESLKELKALGNRVRGLHVFAYDRGQQISLAAGRPLWIEAFKVVQAMETPSMDALLEFVPGGNVEAVIAEATVLHSLIGLAEAQTGSHTGNYWRTSSISPADMDLPSEM